MKKNRTSPVSRPRPRPRLRRAAAVGLAAAVAVTILVDTARHAALVKGTAQPPDGGQKLSLQFILASDFAVTFVAVTAVVFIAAVAASRRARRVTRPDGAPARRGRRVAAGRW
jgi:hypothetical protein